jgi:hypothetical protein
MEGGHKGASYCSPSRPVVECKEQPPPLAPGEIMSNKLERDIEEILAKVDRFPPKRSLWGRLRGRLTAALQSIGRPLATLPRPRVSVGQVLLLGIALIVIAWVFGDSLGGAGVVRGAVIAAIVLFVGAFIFSLRRQSASRMPEKRWRGQTMDLYEARERGSWWSRWWSRR